MSLTNNLVFLTKCCYLTPDLYRVAESEHCKMPRSNIARVFAPTLVASIAMTDMDSAMRDTKRSAKVVECMLDLPPSYWTNMLNPHEDCSSPTPFSNDEAPNTPGTPEMLKGKILITVKPLFP